MQSEEYRAKADELRSAAERAKDPAVRSELLLMAQDWDQLAEKGGAPSQANSG